MKSGHRISLLRRSAILALLSVSVLVVGPDARSLQKGPIVCQAAVSLRTTFAHAHLPFRDFAVQGAGSCLGGSPGPYLLTLTGEGSECVGIDSATGDICEDYWIVDVTPVLQSISSGTTRTLDQTWVADDDLTSHVFAIVGGSLPSDPSVGAGVFQCNELAVQWLS